MPLTQAGITYEGFENSGGLEKISLFGLTEIIDQQVETLDSGLDFHVPHRELRITRSHNRRLKGFLNPPRSNCQTYCTDSKCKRKLGGDGPGEEGGGFSGVREECAPRVSLFWHRRVVSEKKRLFSFTRTESECTRRVSALGRGRLAKISRSNEDMV